MSLEALGVKFLREFEGMNFLLIPFKRNGVVHTMVLAKEEKPPEELVDGGRKLNDGVSFYLSKLTPENLLRNLKKAKIIKLE